MNRYAKKITAIALASACVMMVPACSCKDVYFTTGLTSNDVFKIDGVATELDEAMLYLTCEKNLYENSYGEEIWSQELSEGTTLLDYVKDTVKERLAQVSALNRLAKKQKVTLSDKEEKKVSKAAQAYFDGLTEAEKEYMDVSLKSVEKAYSKYALAQKVYNEITKEVNPEISDAQSLVIKVESIFLATSTKDANGNVVKSSKAERKEIKKKMTEIRSLVCDDGAEFTDMAKKYSDDEKTEYVFGRGEMIEEYEKAAYALKAGEVSQVITTSDGFYLIKCIEDYMIEETQKNKEAIIAKEKDNAFMEIYKPYLETLTSEFNDEVWNGIDFTAAKDVKTSNFFDIYNKYMEE